MTKSTSKLFQSEEPKGLKEDALNLPEEGKLSDTPLHALVKRSADEVADSAVNNIADDIVDIDLSATKRKRFRINGDNNKILELNVSDMNIMSRLTAAYERLNKNMEEVSSLLGDVPEEVDEEQSLKIKEVLDDIDASMKKELDYIFDAPVSEVCGDGGSMYDPFEGQFRYEHIIDALSKLYENNLNAEFAKMKKRVSAKTSKYTKKYHN